MSHKSLFQRDLSFAQQSIPLRTFYINPILLTFTAYCFLTLQFLEYTYRDIYGMNGC